MPENDSRDLTAIVTIISEEKNQVGRRAKGEAIWQKKKRQ
jgi:hypothetical protein